MTKNKDAMNNYAKTIAIFLKIWFNICINIQATRRKS